MGATVMAIDVAVCAASAPVFSLTNALYAALATVSYTHLDVYKRQKERGEARCPHAPMDLLCTFAAARCVW